MSEFRVGDAVWRVEGDLDARVRTGYVLAVGPKFLAVSWEGPYANDGVELRVVRVSDVALGEPPSNRDRLSQIAYAARCRLFFRPGGR